MRGQAAALWLTWGCRSHSSLVVVTARAFTSKKTDVVKHPEVFDHVGLLVNGPPGTARLPFI